MNKSRQIIFRPIRFITFLLVAGIIGGCTGLESFSLVARQGDTVGLGIGWFPYLERDDMTIKITDANLTVWTIPGTDPSVRTTVQTYPDPVSKVRVGRETNEKFGVFASATGVGIEATVSGGHKDWAQTVVFFDIPNLPPGTAKIDIEVASVSILPAVDGEIYMEVLPSTGTPHPFTTWEFGALSSNQLRGFERAPNVAVVFSGTGIPAAIEVNLTHDPDKQNGGIGQAYVVHPRADITSVNWTDTGTTTRVILTRSWSKTQEDIDATTQNPDLLSSFDFYVAGKITGVQIASVDAYDIDGNLVTGITAIIQ